MLPFMSTSISEAAALLRRSDLQIRIWVGLYLKFVWDSYFKIIGFNANITLIFLTKILNFIYSGWKVLQRGLVEILVLFEVWTVIVFTVSLRMKE